MQACRYSASPRGCWGFNRNIFATSLVAVDALSYTQARAIFWTVLRSITDRPAACLRHEDNSITITGKNVAANSYCIAALLHAHECGSITVIVEILQGSSGLPCIYCSNYGTWCSVQSLLYGQVHSCCTSRIHNQHCGRLEATLYIMYVVVT